MSHTTSTSVRRSFLKQSAAAASGLFLPTIVPASVVGTAPPSETVVMGMIGTGRQCYAKNIPLFQRQPDCRIAAVCDADSWRMNEAIRRHHFLAGSPPHQPPTRYHYHQQRRHPG